VTPDLEKSVAEQNALLQIALEKSRAETQNALNKAAIWENNYKILASNLALVDKARSDFAAARSSLQMLYDIASSVEKGFNHG
jgi:hypothetical protein